MGCALSSQEKEAVQRSLEIDKKLASEQGSKSKEVKLLLLGAGESGKSTFVKQMKIIHENGYSRDECKQFRRVIYSNTISSLAAIIKGMDILGINFANPARRDEALLLFGVTASHHDTEPFTPTLMQAMRNLWADPGVQLCFRRSSEYQLNDSAQFYLDSLERIGDRRYVPNTQDILRTRVKSTGIVESTFNYRSLNFRVVDVGGQRSERKKWIHCFEDVTAILFFVSLSAYDLGLREEQDTNRMEEALRLFNSILNNKWFLDTSVILFLNKKDLFERKIKERPLRDFFPDYRGQNSFQDGVRFICDKFVRLNKNPTRKTVYTHVTCATDTSNVQFVFEAVTDIIIAEHLRETGLF
ncbi:guanine nucleotide-binding protein G(o) subunit alpha-like [Halichondria panicea]|uniref:guanine nucleotide-binding protein G(o) subunit alpha-like n=1 Tax=Halichondria panicea TaxID=6063 RepID=UPI00312BB17F